MSAVFRKEKWEALIGKRFTRLTITGYYSYRQKNGKLWTKIIARCDCGNTINVNLYSLTHRFTQSCGCFHKEKLLTRNLKQRARNGAAKHMFFVTYRRNANKRNIEFLLSEDDIINIATNNCYYCNAEPSRLFRTENGSIILNGVDRKDNDKGYTKDNCVPCCTNCNYTKRSMKLEDFYKFAEKLYLSLKEKGIYG